MGTVEDVRASVFQTRVLRALECLDSSGSRSTTSATEVAEVEVVAAEEVDDVDVDDTDADIAAGGGGGVIRVEGYNCPSNPTSPGPVELRPLLQFLIDPMRVNNGVLDDFTPGCLSLSLLRLTRIRFVASTVSFLISSPVPACAVRVVPLAVCSPSSPLAVADPERDVRSVAA